MKLKELHEAISPAQATRQIIADIKDGKGPTAAFPVKFNRHKVNKEGEVEVSEKEFVIRNGMTDLTGKLAFKMKSSRTLYLEASSLSSFENFPDVIKFSEPAFQKTAIENQYVLPRITTLDGITPDITGDVRLGWCHNLSWANAHKHFHIRVAGVIYISPKYKGPLLGLLKVPELIGFRFDWDHDGDKQSRERHRAIENIINTRIQSDRDILACQEQLIEAGYKEYARL